MSIARRLNDAAIDRQSRLGGRALRAARKVLVRASDPVITTEVAGRALRMPLSHELPHHVRAHPTYSRNIGTLARATHEAGLPDLMIDVGANVGDTAAFVLEAVPEMKVLCIDADDRYTELLRHNAASMPGVRVVGPVVLAATSDGVAGVVQATGGTARVVTATSRTPSTTLDDVLEEEKQFASASILKTDTDGFEAEVLAGATALLRRTTPILHLEYDPRLLAAAGTDGLVLLRSLADHGYGRAVVYDNLGVPLTSCDITSPLMRDLHQYALAQSTLYYDLVVAPAATATVVHSIASAEGLAG
jgi:FkbM family methyltransferase